MVKKKNKEVMLSELCCRLPYEVKCDIGDNKPYTLNSIEVDYTGGHLIRFKEMKNGFIMEVYLSEVKPYLFPMSSMTEEQSKEFYETFHGSGNYDWTIETFDWLNKNHFDYRDLIGKGLAHSAVGLNIY
jgi:hypothetical protein